MNKKVKALLLVLCALVFAVAGVFATLAYLNDTTDEVVNAISVGDVKITLDEKDLSVDEYGVVNEVGTRSDDGNEYNLVPGMTYPKDPTVHVVADSEPALVFVRVTNEISAAEVAVDDPTVGTIADQILANGWELVPGYTDLYVYNDTEHCVAGKPYVVSTKDAAQKDIVVFEQFKVNPDLDFEATGTLPALSTFEGKTIKVKAFAVQAYGLLNADGTVSTTAIDQAATALGATAA